MIRIEIATLVAGSETPAGDGISGAQRCVLMLPNQSKRAAVLKRGPLAEVMAETFCALLLRAWRLPVPDPFLVVSNGAVAFASGDVGYPNLKQSLGLQTLPDGPGKDAAVRVAMQLACSLPTAPLAAACDEAIDNRDRNLGNILWDGRDEAWIDHAMALGQGQALPDRNLLCHLAVVIGQEERFCRAAVAHSLALDRTTASLVDSALLASPLGATNLAPIVAARLATLGNRLLDRFPKPPDLLSNE